MNYIVKFYENFEDAKSGKNLKQSQTMDQFTIDTLHSTFSQVTEFNGNSIYKFLVFAITIETDEKHPMRINSYHFKSDNRNPDELLDGFDDIINQCLN